MEHRTPFVPSSQYVLFREMVLACFDPQWPNVIMSGTRHTPDLLGAIAARSKASIGDENASCAPALSGMEQHHVGTPFQGEWPTRSTFDGPGQAPSRRSATHAARNRTRAAYTTSPTGRDGCAHSGMANVSRSASTPVTARGGTMHRDTLLYLAWQIWLAVLTAGIVYLLLTL
jgi:hypothetical protein